MSSTRYLEINSTYRNRNEWPLPAQFELPISQTGRNKTQALDPVSDAAPITSWRSNSFQAALPGATVSTTVISTSSSPDCFLVSATTGQLQPTKDFYINAIANNTTLTQLQRITSYTFLGDVGGGSDHAEICIASPYGAAFAVGDTITITDPTNFTSTTNPDIFVPAGRIPTNAYNNTFLFNETRNQSRPITGYSFDTHLLTIDTSAAFGGAVATWTATDSYSIRKALPILRGASPGGNTTTTVVLPATASTVDDTYNGDFLEFPEATYPVVAPVGEARRIVDYDGATQTATVAPPFTAVAGAIQVAILQFTSDYAIPFNYTGSLVSQSEDVCYEIELINLILPNRTLNVSRGGRIAFYPYVYVELRTVSSSGGYGPGTIYSNNPNSTRMLFRAPVDDTPTPLISPFIKIDSDGMTQTVKFKPNDNLQFSVRMPDGSVFQLDTADDVGPLVPNELLQISAAFSLKRIVNP